MKNVKLFPKKVNFLKIVNNVHVYMKTSTKLFEKCENNVFEEFYSGHMTKMVGSEEIRFHGWLGSYMYSAFGSDPKNNFSIIRSNFLAFIAFHIVSVHISFFLWFPKIHKFNKLNIKMNSKLNNYLWNSC